MPRFHEFVPDTPFESLNDDGEIIDTVRVEELIKRNAHIRRREDRENRHG